MQHRDIVDPEIHEPKGVSTAPANRVYVATGTGSGTWRKLTGSDLDTSAGSAAQAFIADGVGGGTWKGVQIAEAAGLKGNTIGDTTGIDSATFKSLNNSDLGGTFSWTEVAVKTLTTNITSGYISVVESGLYKVEASIAFEPATAGGIFEFTIGVDSGSGFVNQSAIIKTVARTSGTADTVEASINSLINLSAGSKVDLRVRETTGGEEAEFVSVSFTLIRIS